MRCCLASMKTYNIFVYRIVLVYLEIIKLVELLLTAAEIPPCWCCDLIFHSAVIQLATTTTLETQTTVQLITHSRIWSGRRWLFSCAIMRCCRHCVIVCLYPLWRQFEPTFNPVCTLSWRRIQRMSRILQNEKKDIKDPYKIRDCYLC